MGIGRSRFGDCMCRCSGSFGLLWGGGSGGGGVGGILIVFAFGGYIYLL